MATVRSYNATTQRVVVVVDILQQVDDNTKKPNVVDTNPVVTQDPVVLHDIPVVWDRTSSGYTTYPLLPGDRGELHVQDRDPTAYLLAGLQGLPPSFQLQDLNGAMFHPCKVHTTEPIVPATSQTATVLHGDARINLGRTATQPVLLGAVVQSAMTGFTDAIAAAPADGNGFAVAMKAAGLVLGATIASWASPKTFTE